MLPSSKYVVTYVHENPKAIAIVLGPLGTSRANLRRLSDLYLDRQCAVVAARSPPLDFLRAQHGRLKPVARAIRRETESLLRQVEVSRERNGESSPKRPIPVVVHMWSNGGAFLWEELLRDSSSAALDNGDGVLPNLQYVAYDSCPCYLHMPWNLGPFWCDAFPFPGWNSMSRKIYLVAASLSLSAWCLFTCSISRSRAFWNKMTNPPCRHLLYFYSTNDKVSDASRIDQLIHEQRTARPGFFDVTVRRYDDSGHCQIDYDHAEEYGRTIDKALQGAVERADQNIGT